MIHTLSRTALAVTLLFSLWLGLPEATQAAQEAGSDAAVAAASEAPSPAAAPVAKPAPAAKPEAEAAASDPAGIDWVLKKMHEGGLFMWFIFVGLVITVLLAAERFVVLTFKLSTNGDKLYSVIEENVNAGNLGAAKEACASVSGSALGTVLTAALEKAGQPEKIIQDAADEADLLVTPKINARTGYLSMIANVSTLLGLLGTIIGLIQAFASLSLADAANKQKVLADGISIAMNTTAFGLIVAIPGMVLFALLMGKSNKMIEDIDLFSVKTINLLVQKMGKNIQVERRNS